MILIYCLLAFNLIGLFIVNWRIGSHVDDKEMHKKTWLFWGMKSIPNEQLFRLILKKLKVRIVENNGYELIDAPKTKVKK